MKNICYIPVGVPGSGKSTWIKNQNFEHSMVISMDDIREEITGSVTDQSQNGKVAAIAKNRFKNALAKGCPNVIWDATSVQRKYRRELIKTAKKFGYEVVCVWFDIPLEVSKERNANRDRVVPEDVLDRMYNSMVSDPPSKDEGFHNVIVVS